MQVVNKNNKITLSTLSEMSQKMFKGLVKAVVDVEKEMMIVDAPMHADQEMVFLDEYESDQGNLWGINLHPAKYKTSAFIEYDSMINLRLGWGNNSRGIDDPLTKAKVEKIVLNLVIE
jgi:hypothetical protein